MTTVLVPILVSAGFGIFMFIIIRIWLKAFKKVLTGENEELAYLPKTTFDVNYVEHIII